MAILTIADARRHLELGEEADATLDAQLGDLILAAEAIVEDEMGRPILGEDGWTNLAAVPPNVVHAIRIALGQIFLNREGDLDLTTVKVLVGRYTRVSFA